MYTTSARRESERFGSTSSLAPRAAAAAADSLVGRPVLLATDGGAAARAAGAVVVGLARAGGVRPVVVRAMDPIAALNAVAVASAPVAMPTPVGLAEVANERHAVEAELGWIAGTPVDWPVRVVVDAAPVAVLDEAEAAGASMIVLGLRRHGVVDRLTRSTTANAVLRDATVPVLAVTEETRPQIRRIVVGVDFGRAGLRAARAALALLAAGGEGGTLVLAYVDTAPRVTREDAEGERVIHEQGVTAAFARLVAELHVPRGVTVETDVLEGAPAEALAELAARSGADAVAVGSRRHHWLDQVLLGSVTASLVRRAGCALLVVPPHRPESYDGLLADGHR